tara:strand:+ start:13 stop:1020 length:1008 start_codon:yes stop_codon:yes gene_type:complete
MKISASIYSDKSRALKDVVDDLVQHQVNLLHVDCNDDPKVFDDIKEIRSFCSIPIDLHLITSTPEKYFDLLRENPVDYLTIQHEELQNNSFIIPDDILGKKGIAITTDTTIDIFENYLDYDFILIMATVPGQSGGLFDKGNFYKIRKFRRKYPSKSIHVDGGVNGEVSFILRNLGVSCSVSGSYLFKSPSIGHALFNLQSRNLGSAYTVSDFMIPIQECPVIKSNDSNLKTTLETIENGKLGFCLVLNNQQKLEGLISSADIRKSLLNNLSNLEGLSVDKMINPKPLTVFDHNTVIDLLQIIKSAKFPVMYLPVVDEGFKAKGIVNFVHLIKGEV